jgi:hypothetical protein
MRRRKLELGLGLVGMAVLGYACGRLEPAAQALAVPLDPPKQAGDGAASSSDYSTRVVATIYGNISITREELGEYLIARFGADRLELLVNKRIIEKACGDRGITVTAAEVEAALEEDMKSIRVNRKEFIEHVLGRYRKTLYEWKEDVIKPRLLLTKLCRDQVQASPDDLQKCFEAHYGEKVECRIILWPKDMEKIVSTQIYGKIRASEEEFDRQARMQPSPTLAASGGRIQPFGRNSTGNPVMEKVAFSLKPGEISEVIGTDQGLLVIKCDRHIPRNTSVKPDDPKIRSDLEREVIDKKVQLQIPEIFKKMREEAKPVLFMKTVTTEEELKRSAEELLRETDPSKLGLPAEMPRAQ